MSTVLAVADAVDTAFDLVGVLLSATAIGSGLAITAAVLRQKNVAAIELWGFRGTAAGFAVGTFLAICTLAARWT